MNCEACSGTGFVVFDRQGYSFAERCPNCYSPGQPATQNDYAATVEKLSHLLNFFPQEDREKALIAGLIEQRVKTKTQLEKLEQAACLLPKWEGLTAIFEAYETAV